MSRINSIKSNLIKTRTKSKLSLPSLTLTHTQLKSNLNKTSTKSNLSLPSPIHTQIKSYQNLEYDGRKVYVGHDCC